MISYKEYSESRAKYLPRLENALKYRCFRTAKARLRDLAHLEHQIRPSVPYQTLYDALARKYSVAEKI